MRRVASLTGSNLPLSAGGAGAVALRTWKNLANNVRLVDVSALAYRLSVERGLRAVCVRVFLFTQHGGAANPMCFLSCRTAAVHTTWKTGTLIPCSDWKVNHSFVYQLYKLKINRLLASNNLTKFIN